MPVNIAVLLLQRGFKSLHLLLTGANKICDLKSLLCKHTNKRKHTRINANTHTDAQHNKARCIVQQLNMDLGENYY